MVGTLACVVLSSELHAAAATIFRPEVKYVVVLSLIEENVMLLVVSWESPGASSRGSWVSPVRSLGGYPGSCWGTSGASWRLLWKLPFYRIA